MTVWAEWLQTATNDDSLRRIASRTALSKSSLSKWQATGRPPAEAVIAVARAYDADLLAGLIAANCIDPDDIALSDAVLKMPTDYLVVELCRRWNDGEMGPPPK